MTKAADSLSVRVATYNVHGGIGLDRRYRPDRCLQVIQALEADVVALQEVIHWDNKGQPILRHWASQLNMQYVFAPTRRKTGRLYGNAILTRLPIRAWRRVPLGERGRERRNLLVAELRWGAWWLKVLCTHLGLSGTERASQARRLADFARATKGPNIAHILAGDFNEWRAGSDALRALGDSFGGGEAKSSFPAIALWIALDRIWVRPARWILNTSVPDVPLARVASDHRPVLAELEIPAAG